jgi:hypothetical protein
MTQREMVTTIATTKEKQKYIASQTMLFNRIILLYGQCLSKNTKVTVIGNYFAELRLIPPIDRLAYVGLSSAFKMAETFCFERDVSRQSGVLRAEPLLE